MMEHPWSALDAAARVIRTPCGDGQMVWRLWGAGEPLVLLHGGTGSWLHWLPTIAAFRPDRLVVVPDLPGLGGSDALPAELAGDGGAAVVSAGLDAVLGSGAAPDLAGFSFGGVLGGLVATRRALRSLTLVGAGGLGVIHGNAKLERVRDKEGAERDAAHRANLHRWMIADPANIDPVAVAIQDWNSRHARFDSRPLGMSDCLMHALPRAACAIAGIWGARDHAVASEPERAHAVLQAIRPGCPFRIIPQAGHWVAYEAPAAFEAALRDTIA